MTNPPEFVYKVFREYRKKDKGRIIVQSPFRYANFTFGAWNSTKTAKQDFAHSVDAQHVGFITSFANLKKAKQVADDQGGIVVRCKIRGKVKRGTFDGGITYLAEEILPQKIVYES